MKSSRNIEIVYVEDNLSDAEIVLHILKKSVPTAEVLHVENGEEALDFVFNKLCKKSCEYTPKLVFLDLKLPMMDGFDVLNAIKSNPNTRAIPVVVLSASQEESDIRRSYNLGANSYLVKSVNFDFFADAIRKAVSYWLSLNKIPD